MTSNSSSRRIALVTGTNAGIGAAIAARLAEENWQVIGVDLSEAPSQSPLATHIVADLTQAVQVQKLAEGLSGVQALVHAAGFMRTGSLADLDPADGDAMWALHVRALIILAKTLCPKMTAGGRVVAIGSRTSAGAAGKSQYAACKAAVTSLIRSWAIELAPRSITANVVAPAATATRMITDPNRAEIAPIVPPIGRFIEPYEVAAYVRFILSDEASAITGQNLIICGGASL